MTKPQVIIPGQTIFTTIKTINGSFFLTPTSDGYQTKLTGYLLGCALRHAPQSIHAFCAMSNHFHYVLTDVYANRPSFRNHFHAEVAKKHNTLLQRKGSFWESTCHEWILDKVAMKRQLLYTWGNVLEANMVERVEDWKGFMILPKHWGKPQTFKRPDGMPTDNPDVWPEFVTFTPAPPAFYQDMPLPDAIAYFEAEIAAMELGKKRCRTAPILGMDACFEISPFYAPDAEEVALRQEVVISEPRTLVGKIPLRRDEPKPIFSIGCKGEEKSIAVRRKKIRERFQSFWIDHRHARLAFREDKSTPMPFGTYQRCQMDHCESLEPVPGDSFIPREHGNHFYEWFWSPAGERYWPVTSSAAPPD